MKKFNILIVSLAALLTATALPAFAEIAVIVNPGNSSNLDTESINRIFLGKTKSFPNGQSVTPVNQKENSSVRNEFDNKVLEKSPSQMKAYWSKLIFTGKGTPPEEVGDDAAMKAKVASDASAIGYIDASAVDATVKVVQTF